MRFWKRLALVIISFINWIKILNDQQSCVINGGCATKYFSLKRVAHKVILYQHIFLLSI